MDAQTNAGSAPGSGAGPHPGAPHDIRRLYRRPDLGMVAGVAAGLGEYFDIDPVLFRVGFVLITLLGGLGVLVYGLAWWIIPPAPAVPGVQPSRRAQRSEGLRRRLQGSPAWVGIALVIFGFAVLASHTRFWRGDIVWGIALIALGIVLFKQHRDAGTAVPPVTSGDAATAEATPPAVDPWVTPAASLPQAVPPAVSDVPAVPVASPAPPVGYVAPRRRRERSSLGWLTIGLVLLVVGVASLLDAGNAVHLSLHQYLALALSMLGIGIFVGSWWGRARWLIVPAILVVPFLLAASLIRVPFAGGSGDRLERPQTLAALRPVYHQVAGQFVLDLRDLPLSEQRVSVRATAVAGHLKVIVPTGVTVNVHAQAGAGEVDLYGERFDGFTLDVFRSTRAPRGAGTVNLDLETSFGQVEVER